MLIDGGSCRSATALRGQVDSLSSRTLSAIKANDVAATRSCSFPAAAATHPYSSPSAAPQSLYGLHLHSIWNTLRTHSFLFCFLIYFSLLAQHVQHHRRFQHRVVPSGQLLVPISAFHPHPGMSFVFIAQRVHNQPTFNDLKICAPPYPETGVRPTRGTTGYLIP